MEMHNTIMDKIAQNVPSSDTLACDPLSACISESLNLDVENEEKAQNLVSCRKQIREENKTEFPAIIVHPDLCSEETPSNFQEKDPLSGIFKRDYPEEPLKPKIPSLVKNEPLDQKLAMIEEENKTEFPAIIVHPDSCSEETPSNFQEKDPLSCIPEVPLKPRISSLAKNEPLNQRLEDGDPRDPEPVCGKESNNESHILERNKELLAEHGLRTLNDSFLPENPEIIGERRIRKSAAAALALLRRSRVENDEESTESEVSSDDEYSIESESSMSEEEVHSRSVKQKVQASPLTSTTASTSMTTNGPSKATSPSPLSTVMSSCLRASFVSSEKCVSSGVEMECHSSNSPPSHPEDHNQASVESHYLQNLVINKNSLCQQQTEVLSGLISAEEVSRQEVSTAQITQSNFCQNYTSNLQVLHVYKKSVSLLKPLSGQTVKNHFAQDRVEVHKMPIKTNTPNCVQKTLIVASAQSNKTKSLLLHSKKQIIPADNLRPNKNNECKESKTYEDRIISTGAKEDTESLGEIIIHPATGLLVSKIPCTFSSNNNNNNNKDVEKLFLYECLKCTRIFSSEQYHRTHHPSNSMKRNIFTCHICMKVMSLHSELAKHYCKIHGRKQACAVCGKMQSNNRRLRRHLVVHSSKRPHICEICSKTFKTIYELRSHLIVHSASANFKCDECNQSFKYHTGLTRHKRLHTGAPIVKCHICNKTYMKESLKRHLTTHSRKQKFPCHICEKKFVSKNGVRVHIKMVHQGIKPTTSHVCEVCGKVKRSIGALIEHMNAHSGEKPYTCHVCGKSFVRRNSLIGHLTVHGENKFKCDMCGYSCKRFDNLTTHIRSHTGEKPYKCSFCEKTFTRLDNLQTHKRQVHIGLPPSKWKPPGDDGLRGGERKVK